MSAHRNTHSPLVESDGMVKCRTKKCRRVLGSIKQGVLTVGGILIWNEAQFSCAACATPYRYVESRADGRSLNLGSAVLGVEGESRRRVVYSTLRSLGQHSQPQAQQEEVML
jgi:hypothetical protein